MKIILSLIWVSIFALACGCAASSPGLAADSWDPPDAREEITPSPGTLASKGSSPRGKNQRPGVKPSPLVNKLYRKQKEKPLSISPERNYKYLLKLGYIPAAHYDGASDVRILNGSLDIINEHGLRFTAGYNKTNHGNSIENSDEKRQRYNYFHMGFSSYTPTADGALKLGGFMFATKSLFDHDGGDDDEIPPIGSMFGLGFELGADIWLNDELFIKADGRIGSSLECLGIDGLNVLLILVQDIMFSALEDDEDDSALLDDDEEKELEYFTIHNPYGWERLFELDLSLNWDLDPFIIYAGWQGTIWNYEYYYYGFSVGAGLKF